MFDNEFHVTLSSAEITLRLIVGSLSLYGRKHVEGEKSVVYFKALSEHFSGEMEEP
jgi:hypothetical protein